MYSIFIISSIFKAEFKSKIVLVLFLALLILGCNKTHTPETSIYTTQNYSDLALDETLVNDYFKTFTENDTIKKEVYQFYKNREYQFAWFNKKGMTAAVLIFYNKVQNYEADFNDESFKNIPLDSLITLVSSDEKSSVVHEKRVRELELLLTTTFFKYSKKVYGGISKNPHELDWYIPRKKKNYQAMLDSLVVLDKGEKIQEPVNQYYVKLKTKLNEYRKIAKKRGIP